MESVRERERNDNGWCLSATNSLHRCNPAVLCGCLLSLESGAESPGHLSPLWMFSFLLRRPAPPPSSSSPSTSASSFTPPMAEGDNTKGSEKSPLVTSSADAMGDPSSPSSSAATAENDSDQPLPDSDSTDRPVRPPPPPPRVRKAPSPPPRLSKQNNVATRENRRRVASTCALDEPEARLHSHAPEKRKSASDLHNSDQMDSPGRMTSTLPSMYEARNSDRLTMTGYIHKIETRLGYISRRRYWFALAEGSRYLYWYKERGDVQCVGRLALSIAAFNIDPKEHNRFIIQCSSNEQHVFDAGSSSLRDEWIRGLQDARGRATMHPKLQDSDSHSQHPSGLISPKSIRSLKSPTSTVNASSASPPVPTNPIENVENEDAEDGKTPTTTASVADLLNELGPHSEGSASPDSTLPKGVEGPANEEGEEGSDCGADSEEAGPSISCLRVPSPAVDIPTSPSSTFYLDEDGSLNQLSLEMPKEVISPEGMLVRMAEDGLERPARRVVDRARRSLRELRAAAVGSQCEGCRKLANALTENDCLIGDLRERLACQEEKCRSLQKAAVVAFKQLDTLKKAESMSEDELTTLVLDKELALSDAQRQIKELEMRLQDAENDNRHLEDKVATLSSDVNAFRESCRSKEAVIMKICEEMGENGHAEESARRHSFFGHVDVPEAIPFDEDSGTLPDEREKQIFEEHGVHDIREMSEHLKGYHDQVAVLHEEMATLLDQLRAAEKRERRCAWQIMDAQAHYYKQRSLYLMVLNHFKTPEKPGRVMEPGVLRRLIDEAASTPRAAKRREQQKEGKATDALGFYLEGAGKAEGDMFESAVDCARTANEMFEANKLEQSEEYMHWLQSWDAFLVSTVEPRHAVVSSPELKALVRTGVPVAYRARVWTRLVSMHVRERKAEHGNGYFECMLKKAKLKKEEGVFDSAIKQIDLDLARTLPTNKFFEDPSSDRIESLRRVLYAFRYHNSEVGYCQGLNRLAAIALLYLSEEESFWFLAACVDVLQPPGYYTSTLIGAVADQKVLRDLVQDKMPRLAAHLKSLEVDLSLFTLSWFLTCFVDVLPHSIYLQIFDVFLYEGNKVLFRFALALLKMGESHVLKCRTIGTVHACLSRADDFVPDFKTFAQVAFNDLNPFPQKAIESKRHAYLNELREQGYR